MFTCPFSGTICHPGTMKRSWSVRKDPAHVKGRQSRDEKKKELEVLFNHREGQNSHIVKKQKILRNPILPKLFFAYTLE